MKLAFWLSVAFVLYTYSGYPLIIFVRSRYCNRPIQRAAFQPFVSIIIAVRNEEGCIARKLQNLATLDYPQELREIIVLSDGSTDGTNALLTAQAGENVHILLSVEHVGKATALNKAVKDARGEVLVFTDARQLIGRDAIRMLAENFSDRAVGCVSGELMMGEDPGGGLSDRGVGLYWRLEKKIRKWESDAGSVVGATGALYAVRKDLIVSFPPGTILDDVYLPLHVIRSGSRVVFEPRALAYDTLAPSQHEFRRKVRTLMGNYQLVKLAPWVLTPANPVAFQFWSHKLFRLWVPFALAVILATSCLLQGPLYHLIFASQLALYGLAVVSLSRFKLGIFKRLGVVSFTFVMLNVAAILALVYFVKGEKSIWQSRRAASGV